MFECYGQTRLTRLYIIGTVFQTMFGKMFDWPHDPSLNKNVPTKHHLGPKSSDNIYILYIAPVRLYKSYTTTEIKCVSLTTPDLKTF